MTKRQMIKTVSELAALQFGTDYADAIDEIVREHRAMKKELKKQPAVKRGRGVCSCGRLR